MTHRSSIKGKKGFQSVGRDLLTLGKYKSEMAPFLDVLI